MGTTTTTIQTTSALVAVHLGLTASGDSASAIEAWRSALEDVSATGQTWQHVGQTSAGTEPARIQLSVRGWM